MPAPGGGRLHRAKDGGCSRGSARAAAMREVAAMCGIMRCGGQQVRW